MHTPTQEELVEAENRIDVMDTAFRQNYSGGRFEVKVAEDSNPGDIAEVYTFVFGLMAGVFRSAHAVVMLTRAGFGVECRPILRSILDQILALYSVKSRGVHAVHAYGKELAYSYSKLLKASELGFPLGAADTEYIQKFMDLSGGLPTTSEGKQAENAIKTFQAGNEAGTMGAAVYQMWLEATPLSKPSMKLSDSYLEVVIAGGKPTMRLNFDSDPDSVVDARLVLSTVIPLAMITYAEIVNDSALESKAARFAEEASRRSG